MAPTTALSAGLKMKEKKYKLKDLKTLGTQLLSSRAHLNNLPLLLTFVAPGSQPQHVLESLLTLQSFFTPLVPDLPSRASTSANLQDESKKDPELIYWTWLKSYFDEFVKSMIEILVSPEAEDTLKEIVFDTIMEFVKMGKGSSFQSAIYDRLMRSIANSPSAFDMSLELLSLKYFKYIDVRYFTYISLEKMTRTMEAKDMKDDSAGDIDGADGTQSRSSMGQSINRIHQILSRIPPPEGSAGISDHEMWSGSDSKPVSGEPVKAEKNDRALTASSIAKKMKLKFTKAWLSFLRLPLPLEVYKEVLVILHQAVIPHLSNPIMLCDFLTRSYDIGGVVSVMALSSLFILMTQHGLEYPNFYEKLYVLLEPSIFMAKHRAKFFELLDACLKSPLLPAYLAAAFAKKLSRLALSIPPSGALVVIALIHNLLRRHPSINCLVHREEGDVTSKDEKKAEDEAPGSGDDSNTNTELSKKRGLDQFRFEETNPITSNAMKSSLWEIDTLRHHYCPPVSRFMLSLENDLTVRAKTTEINVKDFTSGSYATIIGNEIRRRVKQVPLAFYKETPSCLFSESDFPGWTFNSLENGDVGDTNGGEAQNKSEEPSKRQKVVAC